MSADGVDPGIEQQAVVLGRFRSLGWLIGIGINPIITTRRLHAKYGAMVVLTQPQSMPSRPRIMVCVASAELYRSIASNVDRWRTGGVTMVPRNTAAGRLSRSVPRLQGAQHQHYRRLLTQVLSRHAVAAMSPHMAEIARESVTAWPHGQELDFAQLGNDLMVEISIRLLFGEDSPRARPVARMIEDMVAAAWPFPGRAFFRSLRTAPKLEHAIDDWAQEKKSALNKNDIFSALVNSPNEFGEPPDREVINSVLVFSFGAAYDTCQNALAWSVVLLTQHPDIAGDLVNEIRGAVSDGLPTIDKIGDLELLDGVTREAMRLFPPVPIQFRRSRSRTEVNGMTIPEGTRALVSAHLINRNPKLYPEPDRFKPDRWRGVVGSPFEYPVFGAGERMCPGTQFGMQMLKIALATILLTHRIELAPKARINHRSAITLTPRPGVPVILRDKDEPVRRGVLIGTVHDLVRLPESTTRA